MTNRIREIHVRDHLIDVAGSEVWITVVPEQLTPTAELRGRLTGPRCVYATTIEVAYPLRHFPRPAEGLPGLPMRVVIPEPSLWEPECPFLYQGPVELWDECVLCDQVQITHGLRVIRLGPRGLRLNGKPFVVNGVQRSSCSAAEAKLLHQSRINTLLVPVEPANVPLWDLADTLGFFMLGRLLPTTESVRQAASLATHPSCVGWVLTPDWLEGRELWPQLAHLAGNRHGQIIGIELDRPLTGPLPRQIHFVAVEEKLLAAVAEISVPRMLLSSAEGSNGNGDHPSTLAILGRIGGSSATEG